MKWRQGVVGGGARYPQPHSQYLLQSHEEVLQVYMVVVGGEGGA